MENERTIGSVFKRYYALTTDSHFKSFEDMRVSNVRIDKVRNSIEVFIEPETIISKGRLYELENEIKSFYDLRSIRLFPHYRAELFMQNPGYFKEILKETERVGIVAKGFFDHASYVISDKEIEITIPFANYAAQFITDAKTPGVISNIIRLEFGLDYDVIVSKGPEDESAKAISRQLEDLDRELMLQKASYESGMQTPKKAEAPASSGERRMSVLPIAEEEIISETRIKNGSSVFDWSEPEQLFGESFPVLPVPIAKLDKPGRNLVILGEIFSASSDSKRNSDLFVVSFCLYDGTSSMEAKIMNQTENDAKKFLKVLTPGTSVALHGFAKHEQRKDGISPDLTFFVNSIQKIQKILRKDESPKKRVELHLHTTMSNMDALIPPETAVQTAHDWGMPAIAITDHGTVQGYQEAMGPSAKLKQKVIWGIESYFVNDTASAITGDSEDELNQESIAFDIETTGFDHINDHIIEIGAVRIKNGHVLDEFDTFVNPGIHIPEKITELTSITDEMVQDAPSVDEALKLFFDFIGPAESGKKPKLLIAHNAPFDTGFVRTAAQRLGMPFPYPYLDTVPMSRFLNPSLKNHKLDTVAEYYRIDSFHHHRASDDARALALIWLKMIDEMKSEKLIRFSQLKEEMANAFDPKKMNTYHQILLVRNKVGLKNLYRLVSASYLDYFNKRPRIPKTLLEKYREGLIVGSACEAGELFRAVLEGKSESEIEEIVSFYDYLEIQPISNNRFLIEEGRVADEEGLRELNRQIVRLGEKYGKPVCATCDAHFLNDEDEIFRKILLAGQKYKDADRDCHLYLRTTEEMLEEFSYLGEEKAFEVVVTNTNRIADLCEEGIRPFPEGSFTPKMDGAEEDLQRICYERAKKLYGDPLPEYVENRLNKELTSIISNGFAVLYMIAQKLVQYSESQGYLVGSRGSVGSSCVAFFAGISEVNPLKPHYYCPKCQYSDFETAEKNGVRSGFDLPDATCPRCGAKLNYDGHDIPFETFLGFHGDKSPDIDLNFSGEVQGRVHKYTETLFGAENVFRAGTIGVIAAKTAYGYVVKYLEDKGISLPRAEVDRMVEHCTGVKRTTGQHPGGIVVVPKEYEIYDFCPVQHPADDPNSDIVTTHFTFSYLHDTLLKLDELGHDIPTKYKYLEKYTGTSVLDVPMNDRSIYQLFLGTEPLGVTPEDIDCPLGTLGLPELGTKFVIRMLQESKPQSFSDLIQISGLSHGTDVWTNNAQDLIREGTCTISEVIGTRDSIMIELIRYGVESSHAFSIMEMVRKAKGLTPEFEQEMRSVGVPDWYIASCKKIKYMFPKAHAAAYDMSAIRLAWYKLHEPLAFYCAMFTVQPGGFDAQIVIRGKRAVQEEIYRIEKAGKDASPKEQDSLPTLQLVNEAYARGIRFLPVDRDKSEATEFKPDHGAVRMPFSSLPGVGENAAKSIVKAREEAPFTSIQDLAKRSGVTKTVIEVLTRNQVLNGLDETAQISIFNMLQ